MWIMVFDSNRSFVRCDSQELLLEEQACENQNVSVSRVTDGSLRCLFTTHLVLSFLLFLISEMKQLHVCLQSFLSHNLRIRSSLTVLLPASDHAPFCDVTTLRPEGSHCWSISTHTFAHRWRSERAAQQLQGGKLLMNAWNQELTMRRMFNTMKIKGRETGSLLQS